MRFNIYTAGPEVFLPNALEHAQLQRTLGEKYGFKLLHPLDNDIGENTSDIATASRIYRGNVAQIRESHIVVANCNPFRGICMDDGTAFELGVSCALGKPTYGYIRETAPLLDRILRDYPYQRYDASSQTLLDREGYCTENFGLPINLMMYCGMLDLGGRIVVGDFEACLMAVRQDLDSGRLVI